MSTTDQDSIPSVAQIKQKIEDYRTTIQALQCFVSAVTWDRDDWQQLPGSNDSLGRRMDTSEDNRISPSTTVTPDAVVQRNEDTGYVVEAKKSLPNNADYWQSVVGQLEKYDDDLLGWWTDTETIPDPCVVLLLEITRAADFSNHLALLHDRHELSFVRPVSIVEFTRAPEVKEFIFLRTHWGVINDDVVSATLRSGQKIPIEDVILSFGRLQFYDSRPVTEHTMSVLWQFKFTEMKSEEPYNEEVGAWVLHVDTGELTDDLQKLYGSQGLEQRDVSFPKTEWVREAMDAFVRLDLAGRTDSGRDEYVVYFRRIRGDIIERFAKHRTPIREEPEGEQLSLFEFDDSHES